MKRFNARDLDELKVGNFNSISDIEIKYIVRYKLLNPYLNYTKIEDVTDLLNEIKDTLINCEDYLTELKPKHKLDKTYDTHKRQLKQDKLNLIEIRDYLIQLRVKSPEYFI